MSETAKKQYTVYKRRGLPLIGELVAVNRNPFYFMMENALHGDIAEFHVLGFKAVQLNHPDLIRYVLMENHKNYIKSKPYIRFQSAIGLGLLTSNGEKWRRDRQKIQPMFKRELIDGYYFQIANEVAEKYKRRWLGLTSNGPAELDISHEMASITLEIIVRLIFGKDNLDDETVASLQHSYSVFLAYLKNVRLIPYVDFDKVFHTRRYREFAVEIKKVESVLSHLAQQYRKGMIDDKYNMLALLIEAQKQDPENFSEKDIRDHCVSMVFAGFESTSILMQWMWWLLDSRPDVTRKLRGEITDKLPNGDFPDLDTINTVESLTQVFLESMRLYPPFWMTGREPVEDDRFGDYKIERGTTIMLPQIVMHRHPQWWHEPNAFIPERFTADFQESVPEGLYFPFSQGPRKCSGYKLVEMEAKVILAKLLPHFGVTVLNALGNNFEPGISLKAHRPVIGRIYRV